MLLSYILCEEIQVHGRLSVCILHHEPLNEVMDFHETWIYTGIFARINIPNL